MPVMRPGSVGELEKKKQNKKHSKSAWHETKPNNLMSTDLNPPTGYIYNENEPRFTTKRGVD